MLKKSDILFLILICLGFLFSISPVYAVATIKISRPQQQLCDAIRDGKTASIYAALAHGADINGLIRRDDFYEDYFRPLDYACSMFANSAHQLQIIQFLLQHGGNVNGGTLRKKFTPLMLAATGLSRKRPETYTILSFLFAHGANVNAADWKGVTTLMDIARDGDSDSFLKMAQFLMDKGADADLKAQNGDTAYALAVKNGNEKMAALLSSHTRTSAAAQNKTPDLDQSRALDEVEFTTNGDESLSKGNFTDAEHSYRAALALNPDDADCQFGLGMSLFKQKKYAEAEPAFRSAVQLKSGMAEYQDLLGIDLIWQQKYADAEPFYREAIRLYPGGSHYHGNLGNDLYNQQRYAEAEICHREAALLDPANADFQVRIGDDLYSQGKYAEALPFYRAAIRLDPNTDLYQQKLQSDQDKISAAP